MQDYRSSNTRFSILIVNMIICLMVIMGARDNDTAMLAFILGSLNALSIFDCLNQKSLKDKEKEGDKK